MEENLTLVVPETFSQRLKKSYKTELLKRGYDLEDDDFDTIFQYASEEFCLNSHVIALYDFCIIASEADFPIARKIKQYLIQQLRLRGCLFEDIVLLGKDIFETYQNMIDRSTKILFLITQNFTTDNFCMRVQNGTVFKCIVSKAVADKAKCVPLILESAKQNLPLALEGIAGIVFNDSNMVPTRDIFRNAFTCDTRQREMLQRRYNEKCFKSIVDKKVQEAIESLASSSLSLTHSSSTQIEAAASGSNNQIACQVKQQMPHIVSQVQEMALNMKTANANSLQQSQLIQPHHCQISQSKNVRIGDHWEVNVFLDGNKQTSTCTINSSTEDSSSDED